MKNNFNFNVLGCGGAFAKLHQGQSNFLIEKDGKKLLIDCGTDCKHLLNDFYKNDKIILDDIYNYIDSVYISHVHADHSGGLEWLGFSSFFMGDKKINLIIPENIKTELWGQTLKGGMGCISNKKMELEDYFNVYYIKKSFKWNGIKFDLKENDHIGTYKQCYGLIINDSIYFSGDNNFDKNHKQWLNENHEKFKVIFMDCDSSNKVDVHPKFNELNELDSKIKEKMYLYHYGPTRTPYRQHGFKGALVKGQVINFQF
jgi:ribonuclease BN (tRNA processing enzyme)